MKNKGFTLIELLIVIITLGLLVATAAPNLLRMFGGERHVTCKSPATGEIYTTNVWNYHGKRQVDLHLPEGRKRFAIENCEL